MRVNCVVCAKAFDMQEEKPHLSLAVCNGECFKDWLDENIFTIGEVLKYDFDDNTKRSKYEEEVADTLVALGIPFMYEKVMIKTGPGEFYLPDFYLYKNGVYLEAKGIWKGKGLKKVEKARKMGHEVIAVEEPFLRRLQRGVKRYQVPAGSPKKGSGTSGRKAAKR